MRRAGTRLPSAVLAICGLLAAGVTALFAAAAIGHASAGATGQRSAGAANDHFSSHISGTSGRYKHDHGRQTIDVRYPHGSKVTLKLHALHCKQPKHCLKLAGTLTGTVTWAPVIPDAGRSGKLHLSGTVKPTGHVTGTGTIHLPGNVKFRFSTLTLTLTNGHGTIHVTGRTATAG